LIPAADRIGQVLATGREWIAIPREAKKMAAEAAISTSDE
jgi:hypothetical protein